MTLLISLLCSLDWSIP